MPQPEQALGLLREVGAPGEMFDVSRRVLPPSIKLKSNTHIHLPPNFSRFKSVGEAVGLAAEEGLDILGAGNYYDFGVYGDFAAEAHRCGILPLFGVEVIALIDDLKETGVKVNDPGNPGRMYLCGKGISRFDPPTGQAAALLAVIRQSDDARMAAMIDRLNGIFESGGIETRLDAGGIVTSVAAGSSAPRESVTLQERHVARAFQEALFDIIPEAARRERLGAVLGEPVDSGACDAVALQNDIRRLLMKAGRPAFVEERFVSFDEAFRLILELGGIPCYPTLADGAAPVCPFEEPVDTLIKNIHDRNIHCAEFIPARNDAGVLRRYVTSMRRAGLVVTAGTEHNTLSMLPLTPAAAGGAPLPAQVEEIFCEGALVAVAHQFLSAHGECGYIDDSGRLNPAWADQEDRIEAFAALGAAVVQRY